MITYAFRFFFRYPRYIIRSNITQKLFLVQVRFVYSIIQRVIVSFWYVEQFASPFVAASRGFIDDVIRPRNTRWRLCRALEFLRKKEVDTPWKKHDNLPL